MLEVDLFVLMQRQKHAIFTECNIKVILEVPEIIPLRHLVLCEWSLYTAVRILIVPPAITLPIRLFRDKKVQK